MIPPYIQGAGLILVDIDSPMPEGLHLCVEPCEHRSQDGFLPAFYNLQLSKPMTLQGELMGTCGSLLLSIVELNAAMNGFLAEHARVAPLKEWDDEEAAKIHRATVAWLGLDRVQTVR